MSRTAPIVTLIVVLAGTAAGAYADGPVTITWPRGRLVLSEDARVRSLVQLDGRRECAREDDHAMALVVVDGESHAADGVAAIEGGFSLSFDGVDTVLEYAAEPADGYLLLTLRSIEGARPERVTLRLPIAIDERVGRLLNAGWDEQTVVCVMAGNLQTRCGASRGEDVFLTCMTQDAPGPRLEGAVVALIVCPTERFRAIAREVSHACGLPTNETADGTPVKQTDRVRGSYWFIAFGPDDVDRVIEYCHEAGIGQVMMSSSSWCRTVGHYTFRDRYPNGREDLRAVVDRLHDAGILVGMHCFVSKVSKTDAYVTPVPDRRFWVDHQTELAADIDAEATEITVAGDLSEWAGSPVSSRSYWEGGVERHRECIIGDEIIRYEAIGPEGQWDTFVGCERGAWGTHVAAHPAGEAVRHYGVDGCINGYIIDQETDLMDEVADRIAGIFNDCGFDMVYFDGGEDVDRRRFNYYSTNFQHQAMRRFTRRPIIHMGTVLTHRLWHSFARSGTVDTYLNTLRGAIRAGREIDQWPTVREHIDRSVRRVQGLRDDMMPAELGWFGVWGPTGDIDGLQLDEIEYLMCKSLAMDAPVSLQTGLTTLDTCAMTPAILRIFRRYETLRMQRALPPEQLALLAETGRDFAMLQDGGEVRFVEVAPVEAVGGGEEVRALVGELDGGSLATLWHEAGRNGRLRVNVAPHALTATDFAGNALEVTELGGATLVPFGAMRTTLRCPEMDVATLRGMLADADVTLTAPEMVCVQAEDARRLVGEMALGSQVGIEDEGAFGDVVVCTEVPDRESPREWFAEYEVQIPHEGPWTVWARVRYPSGGDMSFGLVRPGEEVTLNMDQVLGNCGQNDERWHWTGRGGGLATEPPGVPITMRLPEGPFVLRVYAREGGGLPQNPRLDVICLTEDALTVPTDEVVLRALGEQ